MYDIPREEPTHESVDSLLESPKLQSRADKFFKAAADGDKDTLLRYIKHIPDCTSWIDKVRMY